MSIRYRKCAQAGGDKARPFGEYWAAGLGGTTADPAHNLVLHSHLKMQATAPAAQTQQQESGAAEQQAQQAVEQTQTKQVPSVNGHAAPSPNAGAEYTPGSISKMAPEQFKAQRAALYSGITPQG